MKTPILITYFLLSLILVSQSAIAQESKNPQEPKNPEIVRHIHENLQRAGINTNPYEYLPTEETPAPRGYKPLYISHYGRHGSRNAWARDSYPRLMKEFGALREAGLLTPEGEKTFDQIKEIVELHAGMDGRLTPRGAEEHRQIAGRMYSKYKSVFHGRGRKVRAISSIVPRCLVSMSAFTGELLSREPGLDMSWDTGEHFMKICSTEDSRYTQKSVRKLLDEQARRHVPDTAAFMKRLFTDPAAARGIMTDPVLTMRKTFDIAAIRGSYYMDDSMLRIFSEDDLYWYAQNISMDLYLRQCNSVEWGDERMQPVQLLVDDIVTKADEAIAGGNIAADLRFGHEYQLLAISSRLGVKGVAERRSAKTCLDWPGYLYSPFACNLQMIFFRNRGGEVLVKFYLNERETSLITLDGGPYYKWKDVKQAIAYHPVMGEVEEELATSVPEVSGVCQAPDGKGFLAASDENGIWYVSPSGESRKFFVSAGWLDCEGVTVDPGTKDVYYIVEGKQELRRLSAPDYTDDQLVFTLQDAGLNTNSGLEGVSWYKDGMLFLGNQRKPNLLVKYSLKDGVVARTELVGTREIADLYYDPVRNKLWIADSINRTLNMCNPEGEVLLSWPVPFIDNGEGIYVDHANSCVWVGDDTTSKLYKIHFDNL